MTDKHSACLMHVVERDMISDAFVARVHCTSSFLYAENILRWHLSSSKSLVCLFVCLLVRSLACISWCDIEIFHSKMFVLFFYLLWMERNGMKYASMPLLICIFLFNASAFALANKNMSSSFSLLLNRRSCYCWHASNECSLIIILQHKSTNCYRSQFNSILNGLLSSTSSTSTLPSNRLLF